MYVVFWTIEYHTPAVVLSILLRRAGIEENPGPTYKCPVCRKPVSRNSMRCQSCNEWCHLRCSGLNKLSDWHVNFIAPCCAHRHRPPSPQTPPPPPPSPPPSPHKPAPIKILQFNCNGLRDKLQEILNFMEQHNIQIAALQETKLSSRSNVSSPNHSLIRADREKNKGGGIAFLIHNSVPFSIVSTPSPANTQEHVEQQAIKITSGNSSIVLINVYVPPYSSCPPGSTTSIDHLLEQEHGIIMGDFNAHHSLWHSNLNEDSRGTELAAQISESAYGVANDPTPTRVAGDTRSSPDITIIHPSLLPASNWATHTSLSSDHLPIVIELQREVVKISATHRTYVNFAKADWIGFQNHLEDLLRNAPPPHNVHTGERILRNKILTAAKRYVPAGCIREIRPNFPREAARLADERDRLRQNNPSDPSIKTLSIAIKKLVNDYTRNKWRSYVDKCKFNSNTNNLWRMIRNLSNKQEKHQNINLQFPENEALTASRCAQEFNKQFTPHPTSTDKTKRKTIRHSHKQAKTDENIFTIEDVTRAIQNSKTSKALGPDGIAPIMLKHLGPIATNYITELVNTSMRTMQIPNIWKVGRIIPLPKPGKPANQGKSYRPISLLSPIAKLMEKLMLPTLNENLVSSQHQHGFRKGRSTVTALQRIQDQIQRGLNQRKPNQRTIMVAIDLSKAFDTVSHGKLLEYLNQSSLPPHYKRWLANYMQGRQTYVEFRGAKSKLRKVKQGVPQGGVLSPILFNFYVRNIPEPPEGITLVSYADDCTVLISGNDLVSMCNDVNRYLNEVSDWFQAHHLELSPDKSTATLFTTWTKEVSIHLDINIHNIPVPTINNPKILGVTFDSLLTFNQHAKNISNKMNAKNNVMKSIAGSTWGKDKDTLATTYKAISRPIANYGAPIYAPQLSDSNWSLLQRAQNSALRTITGCHTMTHQDHLHQEAKILPIRDHTEMMAKQHILRCHLPTHPNFDITQQESPPRHIRRSAFRKYKDEITQHIPTTGQTSRTLQRGITNIHTHTVNNSIQSYLPNRVLNGPPPPVREDEESLPRCTRATLAQLRSGWCKILNSYISRIDNTVQDICPDCGSTPHDVEHLFNCSRNPTTLKPIDLWKKPREVANFLKLKIDDDDNDDL